MPDLPHSDTQIDEADEFDPEPAAETPARLIVVGAQGNGERLDRYLAAQLPGVSRSRVQQWIEEGAVRRNGLEARARSIVYEGDEIGFRERSAPQDLAHAPEAMPLDIVWEDESIMVLNKPAGLVVHPGAGNWSGTLLNGLLAYDASLAAVPRAGIVHRLDAGTSGLMVIARTVSAQFELVRQLQLRSVVREYWALVAGAVAPSLTIDAALARDPRNPLRFRVSSAATARPARTWIRRIDQWTMPASPAIVSWIACRLDTGRTHQIRVHLESIGHPLLGDPVYRRQLPLALSNPGGIGRQALHACRLQLLHPVHGEAMAWSCPPPQDLHKLLRTLGASEAQIRPPYPQYIVPGAAAVAGARGRSKAP